MCFGEGRGHLQLAFKDGPEAAGRVERASGKGIARAKEWPLGEGTSSLAVGPLVRPAYGWTSVCEWE